MNKKEFLARWKNSKIKSEYFYLPAKKEEEIKYISCYIRFIMSSKYDLTEGWIPLTQEDINNYQYSTASCGCIIKNLKDEIVFLRRSLSYSFYLRNFKCGKYFLKILLSNHAEIDNKWIELNFTEEDNGTTKNIVLTPQNNLFKTEISLLPDAENSYFIQKTSDWSTNIKDDTTINYFHVYGAREIKFYDKDNNLITSMNTLNSGIHRPLEVGGARTGMIGGRNAFGSTLSVYAFIPESDVYKLSCSYDLYEEITENTEEWVDPFIISLSYTRYAATRSTRYGRTSSYLLPTHYEYNGYARQGVGGNTARCLNPQASSVSFGVDYYGILEIESSSEEITRDPGYQNCMEADNYYNQITTTFSSLYYWLKNYDNYKSLYENKKTIDNGKHYFDGIYLVQVTYKRTSKESNVFQTTVSYASFGTELEAQNYIEETEQYSHEDDYWIYEYKCEIIYKVSQLKFPVELEQLKIFNYRNSLNTTSATFYENNQIVSPGGNIYETDTEHYGSLITKSWGYQLFTYLQTSDDISDYNNIPDIY